MTLVNEIVNTVDTENFEEFMQNFDGLEYQKSFATNETIKHPRRSNGLISTYDLLNELKGYGDPVNDVEEFLQEYGEMEILEDCYDNTYNYNGYLDNYINFSTFELENDQTLVTLSVGLGLDPRGVYTRNVALVFESKYDFLEAFSKDFQLLDFEFTAFDGKKFYGSFDAGALNEFGYLDITDQATGESVCYDETIMDAGDIEDIKDTVAEILETDEISIDKINYFWYACQLAAKQRASVCFFVCSKNRKIFLKGGCTFSKICYTVSIKVEAKKLKPKQKSFKKVLTTCNASCTIKSES